MKVGLNSAACKAACKLHRYAWRAPPAWPSLTEAETCFTPGNGPLRYPALKRAPVVLPSEW